ncbi:GNAT family N-acetyltransferase [Nonomuraea phyllanthi]|uniref:GNAT family N-acetyltransferase n=1 Tax=Nonomuraea phyllanthi TaxID=2219224 RepID=A0A5C4WNT5_9ACTN|nr:GNAT family N-acetyltransferase [Nonomuraea phyllanthi]KAB8195370.1 GNAT family N-acetyltransferase [Nonomuraea phyllanthi]
MLDLFDRELRRGARPDGPGAVIERAGDVVRQVAPADGWNGVLWSALDERTADAAIAEQVRHYRALGRPFEWKLYGHDRPADLDRRLLAAGFTPEPAETLMVAEIARLPAAGEPPEGVRLVPVTDADGVELMAEVHERAFGATRDHIRALLRGQFAAGALVAVVAMAGDEPVSAARMDLHPGTGFASLWGGGTVPEWRGRGLYRALVAHRAREAAARGYRYLQVDASDQSRPILLRLGFEALTTTTPYVHD